MLRVLCSSHRKGQERTAVRQVREIQACILKPGGQGLLMGDLENEAGESVCAKGSKKSQKFRFFVFNDKCLVNMY